jgi:hypothetical protein
MRYQTFVTPLRVVLIAGVCVAALAGCNSAEPADETTADVATLQSATPRSSASAASAGRPVIRPDTTFDEQARMGQPYMVCLKEQGIPMRTGEQGLLDFANTEAKLRAIEAKFQKACESKTPIMAPELDPERNPYYADDHENYHECQAERGVDLVKKDGKWRPGPNWGEEPGIDGLKISEECQALSYDGKKG